MDKRIGRSLVAVGFLFLTTISCNRSAEPQADASESLAAADSAEAIRVQRAIQDSIIRAQQDSIRALLEELSAEPVVAPQDEGRYVVQLSAWRSELKAQEIADSWVSMGFANAYVQEFQIPESPGDTWFRVRIGYFSTPEAAERMKGRLASEYNIESWVSDISQDP